MFADPESRAEWVLTEVLVAEQVEVLPDLHASFPGSEQADAEWIAGMSELGALRTVAACEAAIARTQAVQLRAMARLGQLREDPPFGCGGGGPGGVGHRVPRPRPAGTC